MSVSPADPRPTESRVGQYCDLCRQVDDHPRHHVSSSAGVTSAHFDCCAANGCDVCTTQLGGAPEDARHGVTLIAYLTKGM
jgi:hypothetical protein